LKTLRVFWPVLYVVFFTELVLMNHSTLVTAQLNEPLRAFALTVEEAGPGEFRWRILENHGLRSSFDSVCCSATTFAAYDTALATGYGELQRLIGPDLQFGPRQEPPTAKQHVKLVASATPAATSALGSEARVALRGCIASETLDSLLGSAEEARI
jgi:hypothetical protein